MVVPLPDLCDPIHTDHRATAEMLTRDLKKSTDNLVVHGKLIVNPTMEQLDKSDLNLID